MLRDHLSQLAMGGKLAMALSLSAMPSKMVQPEAI